MELEREHKKFVESFLKVYARHFKITEDDEKQVASFVRTRCAYAATYYDHTRMQYLTNTRVNSGDCGLFAIAWGAYLQQQGKDVEIHCVSNHVYTYCEGRYWDSCGQSAVLCKPVIHKLSLIDGWYKLHPIDGIGAVTFIDFLKEHDFEIDPDLFDIIYKASKNKDFF